MSDPLTPTGLFAPVDWRGTSTGAQADAARDFFFGNHAAAPVAPVVAPIIEAAPPGAAASIATSLGQPIEVTVQPQITVATPAPNVEVYVTQPGAAPGAAVIAETAVPSGQPQKLGDRLLATLGGLRGGVSAEVEHATSVIAAAPEAAAGEAAAVVAAETGQQGAPAARWGDRALASLSGRLRDAQGAAHPPTAAAADVVSGIGAVEQELGATLGLTARTAEALPEAEVTHLKPADIDDAIAKLAGRFGGGAGEAVEHSAPGLVEGLLRPDAVKKVTDIANQGAHAGAAVSGFGDDALKALGNLVTKVR